jgi:hypothetical protein
VQSQSFRAVWLPSRAYGSDLSTDEPYDLDSYIDNPWIFPPPDGSFHRCG